MIQYILYCVTLSIHIFLCINTPGPIQYYINASFPEQFRASSRFPCWQVWRWSKWSDSQGQQRYHALPWAHSAAGSASAMCDEYFRFGKSTESTLWCTRIREMMWISNSWWEYHENWYKAGLNSSVGQKGYKKDAANIINKETTSMQLLLAMLPLPATVASEGLLWFIGIPDKTCNHPGGNWNPGRGNVPHCFRNRTPIQTRKTVTVEVWILLQSKHMGIWAS